VLLQTLQACADVFDYFCNDQYSTFAKVDLAKSSLVDSLITKYKDAWLLCIEEVSENYHLTICGHRYIICNVDGVLLR